MPKFCLNCAHYHPTDKTKEIGVCFEEGDKPIVQRYRFRFETWTCWEENACAANSPLFNFFRRESDAFDREIEHNFAAEVTQAYRSLVRKIRNPNVDQKVLRYEE